MAFTAAKLTGITYLLCDIGVTLQLPPTLLCDNISSLHMIVNPVFHARIKHNVLDAHYVCKKIDAGTLISRYVPFALQVADILTKALSKDHFHALRIKVGFLPLPPSNLRGSDKAKESFQGQMGLPQKLRRSEINWFRTSGPSRCKHPIPGGPSQDIPIITQFIVENFNSCGHVFFLFFLKKCGHV